MKKTTYYSKITIAVCLSVFAVLLSSCSHAQENEDVMSMKGQGCTLQQVTPYQMPEVLKVFEDIETNQDLEEQNHPYYVASISENAGFIDVSVEWGNPINASYRIAGQWFYIGYVKVNDSFFLIKRDSDGEYLLKSPSYNYTFDSDDLKPEYLPTHKLKWNYSCYDGKISLDNNLLKIVMRKIVLTEEEQQRDDSSDYFDELFSEAENEYYTRKSLDKIRHGQEVLKLCYGKLKQGDLNAADSVLNNAYNLVDVDEIYGINASRAFISGICVDSLEANERGNNPRWQPFIHSIEKLIPDYKQFGQELKSLPGYKRLMNLNSLEEL